MKLRQDRVDAYSEYLGKVGSCSIEREAAVRRTLLDNLAGPGGAGSQSNVRAALHSFLSCAASLRSHEARVRLVGTDEVADTAQELTTATANLVAVDPTVDEAEYDEAYRRFFVTSGKFEVLARDNATDHSLGRLLDPLALTVGVVTFLGSNIDVQRFSRRPWAPSPRGSVVASVPSVEPDGTAGTVGFSCPLRAHSS